MVHVYILLFEDKTIWNGTRVIKILSDTLNDLNKLNHGEYSKYLLVKFIENCHGAFLLSIF